MSVDWSPVTRWLPSYYERRHYRALPIVRDLASRLDPKDHRDRKIAEFLLGPLINKRPRWDQGGCEEEKVSTLPPARATNGKKVPFANGSTKRRPCCGRDDLKPLKRFRTD